MSKVKINIKDKRLWLGAAVVAIAVIIVSQFTGRDVIYVYTYEEAKETTVKKTVSVSGTLDLFEQKLVRSEISGEITDIYTDYNEKVKKGDLLLEIHSEDIVESFEKYSDTYRFNKIDLENAKDMYLTKKELYEEELISERELSDARVSYQRKLSSFKDVEKEYERRKELLDSRKVHSPVDGTVIDKGVEENQEISRGNHLFKIAPTLEKMNLTINIDESDIGIVKKGQEVTFEVSAYPDETFNGTIQEIRMNPHDIKGITMYKSLVVCKNPDEKLKPGMSATATIHIGRREDVLAVPNQAFIVVPPEAAEDKDENEVKKVVWVKRSVAVTRERKVKKVTVETGLQGDSYTEITSGELNPSDEVLISVYKEKKK